MDASNEMKSARLPLLLLLLLLLRSRLRWVSSSCTPRLDTGVECNELANADSTEEFLARACGIVVVQGTTHTGESGGQSATTPPAIAGERHRAVTLVTNHQNLGKGVRCAQRSW